jgi:hypothetical protein
MLQLHQKKKKCLTATFSRPFQVTYQDLLLAFEENFSKITLSGILKRSQPTWGLRNTMQEAPTG